MNIELIKEKLTDKKWRLNNLYYIRDKEGKKVRFQMNDSQLFLLDNLWFMSIITKARQLGITTFFAIFYLDQILFSKNKVAGIIAHREEDMKRIFRDKILFALNNMEPWMQDLIGKPKVETANELVFRNGGNIFVSMSTRSLTPNFLHISEYGYICSHDPSKSDEILHGAINSVHRGQMVSIESTAEGREGHFYRLVQEAERKRKQGVALTELDFKSFFFPWWMDPQYTLEGNYIITADMKQYFETLKNKHNISLTQGQQLWYVKKRETVGDGIFEQYPSTIEEAFQVSLRGAFFTEEMNKVYTENRVGFFPIDPYYPVHTAWDLGMNDFNVILFFQEIGEEIRFVDMYHNRGAGLDHYVRVIRERGYTLGNNYLPHDVRVRELGTTGGISREQTLWDLGMRNIYVAPKIGKLEGIDMVRRIFPRMRFHEERVKKLVDSLHTYRRDFDKKTGLERNEPYHGPESHFVDALRTYAVQHQGQTFTQYGDVDNSIITSSFF